MLKRITILSSNKNVFILGAGFSRQSTFLMEQVKFRPKKLHSESLRTIKLFHDYIKTTGIKKLRYCVISIGRRGL